MASTTSGGGLLANVRQQLAQGRSDEEILAGLTAGGLSPTSAARFLERARPAGHVSPSAGPPPLPALSTLPPLPSLQVPPPLPGEPPVPVAPPPPPAAADDAGPKGSWVGVIGGAVVLTIGLVLLTVALSQERHVRLRLPFAIAIGGAGWLLHAARESIDRRRPATWVLPAVAAAPPALAFIALLGTFVATRDRQPAAAGTAPPPAAQARLQRVVTPPSREDLIARHVDTLEGRRRGDSCLAASELARLEVHERIVTLEDALGTARLDGDKACIAYALVRLGETDAMLAQYLEWSHSDSDTLRHQAVVGFGHIGPAAAPQAIPVLEQVLAGQPTAAQRYVVAQTLAKLGPAARPMLRPLAADEDPQVRTIAQRTLEGAR